MERDSFEKLKRNRSTQSKRPAGSVSINQFKTIMAAWRDGPPASVHTGLVSHSARE